MATIWDPLKPSGSLLLLGDTPSILQGPSPSDLPSAFQAEPSAFQVEPSALWGLSLLSGAPSVLQGHHQGHTLPT